MWFKNCHIYHLTSPFEHKPEALAELLETKRFNGVGRQDNEAIGWISPLNRHLEHLVHAANGCILLCLRKEQKVIPASMVKESLEERVAAIQDAEGRKVYGKEKTALKDDILSVLKPKALTKSSHVYGYIDPRNNLMVVNAGSHAVADAFIQLLLDSIGSLGAVKLMGEENPSVIMNRWLLEGLPQDWELTGQYELKDPQDERIAKFKDNESGNQLIGELLEDGYWVQKLGVRYKDQFNAMLQHDLQIKSIKYDDELLKENDDIDDMDQYARLDADLVLMTQTLAEFVAQLMKHFKVNTDKE
ncbi:MAG: recombination-associated protein RdgC [Kangiellaceae bacterium]|nr:recombination-associated protein RdgC [Kangiellaceae bacterium]